MKLNNDLTVLWRWAYHRHAVQCRFHIVDQHFLLVTLFQLRMESADLMLEAASHGWVYGPKNYGAGGFKTMQLKCRLLSNVVLCIDTERFSMVASVPSIWSPNLASAIGYTNWSVSWFCAVFEINADAVTLKQSTISSFHVVPHSSCVIISFDAWHADPQVPDGG